MKQVRLVTWATLVGLVGLMGAVLSTPCSALEGWNTPTPTAAGGTSDLFMDGGRISWGRKNYWLSLEARIFFSQLSGFMEYTNTGTASPSTKVTGDHLDFEKDLGIGVNRAILIPEISFNFIGRQVLRASYFSLVDSAENKLERTFVFGGNNYTASDQIRSDFDLRELRLRYEWGLFNFAAPSTGFGWCMSMGFGADVVWVHAHVDDVTSGTQLDTGHRVGGVPILTLRSRVDFPLGLGIETHVEGMHLGLGYVVRGSVGLDWQVIRFLSIQGGYQVDHLGFNMQQINGVRAQMRLAGIYGSVTAWF